MYKRMRQSTLTANGCGYPAGMRMLVIWGLLCLVGAMLFFGIRPKQQQVYSPAVQLLTSVVLASEAVDDLHVIITLDDKLQLVRWEQQAPQVLATRALDSTMNDIAYNPESGMYVLGGSDKNILIFNTELELVDSISVRGQVTALGFDAEGKISATYGTGQYSERYFVGLFTTDGRQVFEAPVGFTTRDIVEFNQGYAYGTADSRVALLDSNGTQVWKTTISRPVVVMHVQKDTGLLLVGDEQGGLHCINGEGSLLWSKTISNFPVTAIGSVSKEQLLIAGDGNGTLVVLELDGTILESRQILGVEERIANFIVDPETQLIYAYSRKGRVVTIDCSALKKGLVFERYSQLGIVLFWCALVVTVILILNAFNITRNKAKWIGRQLHRSRLAYLLLLPSFATLLVFSYYPIATAVYYSLTNFSLSRPLRFVGFENYVKLMSDAYFWVGIGNMVKILLTNIIKDVTFPLLVAELVFWLRNSKHQYIFRTAFVIPSIVPGVVMVLLWRMIYDPSVGIINKLLVEFGLGQYATAWLGNEQTALWAIIFSGFPWVGVFAFLVYFGGLINISQDVYDAAVIEGVGVLRRFFNIDVPMLKPQFRIILFFSYVGSIQTFANIWIYTRGGPGNATYVPGLQMFLKISEGDYGYASAIGMVLFALAFIGTVVNFRFGKKVDD